MSNFSNKVIYPKWLADEGWRKGLYDAVNGLETAVYPIDLTSARVILSDDFADETVVSTGGSEKASAGILGVLGTIFSLERENGATDKAAKVVCKANTTGELQLPTIILPPDMDTAEDAIIYLMANMAGATDTPTIDVQVFAGVGDTEMGGATAALSTTLAAVSVTVAAADIPAYPNFLNVSLVPGAHTTDEIFIYSAWMEYKRAAPVV